MTEPESFEIAIPDYVLDDLARRLAVARLPPPQIVPDGEPGDPAIEDDDMIERIAGLLAYWRDGYDWRAQERRINAVPQFRATVERFVVLDRGGHFLASEDPRRFVAEIREAFRPYR